MTKYEGDHCEKQEGGCQNSTTCSVEYSNLGSTTDGAEPSLSIWKDGSVLLRERWAPGARDESGPTDPGLVSPSLIGEKWQEGARAAPDGLGRPGGQGALGTFWLTRGAIRPLLAG